MLTLLQTLWQSDSAFPNGAFAFSNGIEGLADLGERLDRTGLPDVLASTLRHRWAGMDRIAIALAFAAADDVARLREIDHHVDAATLPAPQRKGSARNGLAFLTAHARIGTPMADSLKAEIASHRLIGHLPVVQGSLWRHCGMDEASALAASAYGTLAAMVSAAVRLSLIGAVEAQRCLADSLPLVADIIESHREAPPPSLDDIASFSPLLDIATMRHATSDVRLFSN